MQYAFCDDPFLTANVPNITLLAPYIVSSSTGPESKNFKILIDQAKIQKHVMKVLFW